MQHDKEQHQLHFEDWEQVAIGAPEKALDEDVATYYFAALDLLKNKLKAEMTAIENSPDIDKEEWKQMIRRLAYAKMLTGQLRNTYRAVYPEHFGDA